MTIYSTQDVFFVQVNLVTYKDTRHWTGRAMLRGWRPQQSSWGPEGHSSPPGVPLQSPPHTPPGTSPQGQRVQSRWHGRSGVSPPRSPGQWVYLGLLNLSVVEKNNNKRLFWIIIEAQNCSSSVIRQLPSYSHISLKDELKVMLFPPCIMLFRKHHHTITTGNKVTGFRYFPHSLLTRTLPSFA